MKYASNKVRFGPRLLKRGRVSHALRRTRGLEIKPKLLNSVLVDLPSQPAKIDRPINVPPVPAFFADMDALDLLHDVGAHERARRRTGRTHDEQGRKDWYKYEA
jgi:hypothetical protein